jgi:hypothetical protein
MQLGLSEIREKKLKVGLTSSLWIMAQLNHNMMPMDQTMQMQR